VHVLFVCTGNTCRSPLAEAIARKAALDRGRTDIVVSSAGTSAWDGASASDGALLVGIVESATLILAMGPHHIERLSALGGAPQAHLLTDYADRSNAGRAISDPFGGDLDAYRATADELDALIGHVFNRIMNDRPMSSP
jgi:protein-tyrosine-phosphatase